MTVNFIPGEVNKTVQSVVQSRWKNHTILAYCSGNNLIILTDDMSNLQTLYLEKDSLAIAINPQNGKIALAMAEKLVIYRPINEYMKVPRWTLDTEILNVQDSSPINCMDWSDTDELIVGSDQSLTLWHVYDEYSKTKYNLRWNMVQANPVYLVKISKDSSKIASVGKYDTLVKIWNRLSFNNNTLFDLVYLNHNSYVTNLRWRINETKETPETLYTLSSDSVLRIWSSYEFDGAHNIQHWGSIDLYENSAERTGKRFITIIDSVFIQKSFKKSLSKIDSVHLKNKELINLLKENIEIILIVDETGCASIYSLKNVSVHPPKLIQVDKIMQKKFNPYTFPHNPLVLSFGEPILMSNDDISIIIHNLAKGNIRHSVFNFDTLLKSQKLDGDSLLGNMLEHKFTGHTKSIQTLVRTNDGGSMISCSRFQENCIWEPLSLQNGVTLSKRCALHTPSPIVACVLLDVSRFAVTLVKDKIILWDSNGADAQNVCEYDNYGFGTPLSFLLLPEFNNNIHHIVAIYSNTELKAWEIDTLKHTIIPFDIDTLPQSQEIHKISIVDPVGWDVSLDKYERDVLSIINAQGLLTMYSCKITHKIEWVKSSEFETLIKNASHIRGNSIKKIAIVDSNANSLSIWNTKRCVLEYEEIFNDKDNKIRDLDWTCATNNRSILCVGFNHYVSLYTQLRYDYTRESPSFVSIKKIDISNYTTHPIGDSVWLTDGTLVIAAGNQFYVSDKQLDLSNDEFTIKSLGSRVMNKKENIFELASLLNGPLPFYHPQFLVQFLFLNKIELVKEIIVSLFNSLRKMDLDPNFTINDLDSMLGVDINEILESAEIETTNNYKKMVNGNGNGTARTKYHYFNNDDEADDELFKTFNKELCDLLSLKLQNVTLPFITRHQQMTLVNLINILYSIDKYCQSLDENGIRFYTGLKLFQLHPEQDALTMRDINWALHSENKEMLVNILNESVHNSMTWSSAKKYGLCYWVGQESFIDIFEKIAQNEFNINDERDPKNCGVFYLALKKKRILINLWKLAIGNPEQKKMIAFLNNDFKQKRWKSAALKNAFVLLGKHRYMDAASFFLLADSLKDCVNVLIKKVDDIQLAIAVARAYEGERGHVFRSILQDVIIPQTILTGDKWTNSWIYWELGDKQKSIQALIKTPIEISKSDVRVDKQSLNFLEDDPVLIILFNSLKLKNLEYLKGSMLITPDEEFQFILKISQIYSRMGCDYLSLYLVKNYVFLKNETKVDKGIIKVEKIQSIKVQPPPSIAFEEPDMSSFDFGF